MNEDYENLTPKQKEAVKNYVGKLEAADREKRAAEVAKRRPPRDLETAILNRLEVAGVGNNLPEWKTAREIAEGR